MSRSTIAVALEGRTGDSGAFSHLAGTLSDRGGSSVPRRGRSSGRPEGKPMRHSARLLLSALLLISWPALAARESVTQTETGPSLAVRSGCPTLTEPWPRGGVVLKRLAFLG